MTKFHQVAPSLGKVIAKKWSSQNFWTDSSTEAAAELDDYVLRGVILLYLSLYMPSVMLNYLSYRWHYVSVDCTMPGSVYWTYKYPLVFPLIEWYEQ